MTKQKISYKHRIDRDRATKYRAQVVALNRQIAAHKKELRAAYEAGSAATFGAVYGALQELSLCDWLTGRLAAYGRHQEPPETSEQIRKLIAEDYIQQAIKRGKTFTLEELLA